MSKAEQEALDELFPCKRLPARVLFADAAGAITVMKFASGDDLTPSLAGSSMHAVKVMRDIVWDLKYMHAVYGLVCNDMKLANVVVSCDAKDVAAASFANYSTLSREGTPLDMRLTGTTFVPPWVRDYLSTPRINGQMEGFLHADYPLSNCVANCVYTVAPMLLELLGVHVPKTRQGVTGKSGTVWSRAVARVRNVPGRVNVIDAEDNAAADYLKPRVDPAKAREDALYMFRCVKEGLYTRRLFVDGKFVHTDMRLRGFVKGLIFYSASYDAVLHDFNLEAGELSTPSTYDRRPQS
jgi:hypothetical protein